MHSMTHTLSPEAQFGSKAVAGTSVWPAGTTDSTVGDNKKPDSTGGDNKEPDSTAGDSWRPIWPPSRRRGVSLCRGLSPAHQSGRRGRRTRPSATTCRPDCASADSTRAILCIRRQPSAVLGVSLSPNAQFDAGIVVGGTVCTARMSPKAQSVPQGCRRRHSLPQGCRRRRRFASSDPTVRPVRTHHARTWHAISRSCGGQQPS